jgi:hypothetical protein
MQGTGCADATQFDNTEYGLDKTLGIRFSLKICAYAQKNFWTNRK